MISALQAALPWPREPECWTLFDDSQVLRWLRLLSRLSKCGVTDLEARRSYQRMPKKTFLSHSSFDKAFVRRVDSVLRNHGIETWVDESDVQPGQSISRGIQKGLSESDFLLLFLSPKAVDSGWVEREWQSKLHDKNAVIIPLLIESCQIPPFLHDIRYIDFRKDFEEGISLLLTTLSVSQDKNYSGTAIADTVNSMIEDLVGESITMPFTGSIFLIQTLRRIPRSGKHLRIKKLKLNDGRQVPSRSIFDHIMSLGHSADVLYPHVAHGLKGADVGDLARCIAYHELNEVLLGDLPAYTDITSAVKRKSKIFSEQNLRSVNPREREVIAHKFIWMFLDLKHRASLERFIDLADERESAAYRFFRVLDKMDPIIGIWRYLHIFRGQFVDDASSFIKNMRDFFDNPDPAKVVADYDDEKLLTLLSFLQDATMAKAFYADPSSITSTQDWLGFPGEVVYELITGREMHFMEIKGAKKSV